MKISEYHHFCNVNSSRSIYWNSSMTLRLLGQNCKSSPLSRNSCWFIEFLLKLRLNLCNMLCSSYNIVEFNPLYWFALATMLHDSVERSLISIKNRLQQFSYFFVLRCERNTFFYLRHVHTYPDIFESATFSFRIRLPSTRIRCIRHTNPQLSESALQNGNF